jgi:hypothetical protein
VEEEACDGEEEGAEEVSVNVYFCNLANCEHISMVERGAVIIPDSLCRYPRLVKDFQYEPDTGLQLLELASNTTAFAFLLLRVFPTCTQNGYTDYL